MNKDNIKDNKNNMNAKNTAQQGDVVLKRIDGINLTDVKVISKKRMVLAEGEATGHAHVITEDDSELVMMGEKILLNLKNTATLVHEEHNPITLEKGIWEVGKVNEYDYFSKMVKKVVD